MLEINIKNQIKAYFEKIDKPVALIASLDDSEKSSELLTLLQEVAEQSDKIIVSTDGQAINRPSFSVGAVGDKARISFAGLPMGHEMTSFILAVLQSGGYPPKVEQAIIDSIKAVSYTHLTLPTILLV